MVSYYRVTLDKNPLRAPVTDFHPEEDKIKAYDESNPKYQITMRGCSVFLQTKSMFLSYLATSSVSSKVDLTIPIDVDGQWEESQITLIMFDVYLYIKTKSILLYQIDLVSKRRITTDNASGVR